MSPFEAEGADDRPLIVVAGDRPETLRTLGDRVPPDRFRILSCPFGAPALEAIADRKPRLVLVDADRLYLEGNGLLAQVREVSSHTRVVYLDEDGDWLLFIEPSPEDATDLLVNPCLGGQITEAIEELLNPPGLAAA